MEIHELLRVLRRRWWVVLLAAWLGFSIALVASLTAAPTYVATARVFITVRSTGSEFGLWVGGAYTRRGTDTYLNLATSSIALRPVVDQLGLPYTADELASHITVTSTQAEQGVLDIQVNDTTGERAAAIANAVAAQLGTLAENLSSSPKSHGPIVTITQTQPAVAPEHFLQPRTSIDLWVGLIAGLLAGLVIGTRLERSDTRIRSVDDVAEATEVPVLATVPPRDDEREDEGVVDDFRALAEGLRYSRSDMRPGVFLIASTSVRGRRTFGAPLASAVASTVHDPDGRVVHVDADLRSATQASDRPATLGLADVLAGRADVESAILSPIDGRVDSLPAGTPPPNPADLLHSTRTRPLLDALRDRYEVVIIDAAPLLPLADAAVLAPLVDGTILVCAAGTTRRQELVEALDRVIRAGGHPLGIVLTGVVPASVRDRDAAPRPATVRPPAREIGVRS